LVCQVTLAVSVGLAALIFFSVRVFGLLLNLHAIVPIAAAVLLYNIGFFVLHSTVLAS